MEIDVTMRVRLSLEPGITDRQVEAALLILEQEAKRELADVSEASVTRWRVVEKSLAA